MVKDACDTCEREIQVPMYMRTMEELAAATSANACSGNFMLAISWRGDKQSNADNQ
jgi:hypothetical protein